MLARRMLMFVVILLVLASVTAALAPPPPTATQAPKPEPAERSTASTAIVERTINADRRKPVTIVVQQGDILNLTVSSTQTDAVELPGLSAVRAVAPETPVVFDLLTDASGEYPVVLLDQQRTVGTVRVVTQKER